MRTEAVLYGAVSLGFYALDDADYAAALCRAYHDWLHDYCATDPERLKGAAMLPMQSMPHGGTVEVSMHRERLRPPVSHGGAAGSWKTPWPCMPVWGVSGAPLLSRMTSTFFVKARRCPIGRPKGVPAWTRCLKISEAAWERRTTRPIMTSHPDSSRMALKWPASGQTSPSRK